MARVLLIVGGGIAAYKSLELVRLLKKAGHAVTPVLTKSGVLSLRRPRQTRSPGTSGPINSVVETLTRSSRRCGTAVTIAVS